MAFTPLDSVRTVLLSLLLLPCASSAQECPPPPYAAPGSREPNYFSESQEVDLGDAVAEHVQRTFRVIDDDELTLHLRRMGEQLLRQLPPTQTRFRFFLFDLAWANAFGLPGGRIYVSRKLVAAARSEDELAGLLAHEIGHIVTRQISVDMSRWFREVLGVTQFGDRQDVFRKYHQLIENRARKPGVLQHGGKREQQEQIVADQVAVYLTTRAGYAPKSYAAFWDRLAETKGKTGSVLSDFFGMTRPEERRLREILKLADALPASCSGASSAVSPEEFRAWQQAVVSYAGTGRKEAVQGVLLRRTLEPPLRPDIRHLRFSPDGRYLLAQDDSTVYMLSREPLQFLFRIDAPDAFPAAFTPDSEFVVFHTPGLRVERWSVSEQSRVSAEELVVTSGCLQSTLSPTGEHLACLTNALDLNVLRVPGGTTVLHRKAFYSTVTIVEWVLLSLQTTLRDPEFELIQLQFSPDGRYFVAGRNEKLVAADLATGATIPLPGSLRKLLSVGFTFLDSSRIVGTNPLKLQESAVAHFPSGRIEKELPLGVQKLSPASRGDFVLLRPVKNFAVGALNLATGQIFLVNKTPALDIFGTVYASERVNGEVALYEEGREGPVAKLSLPVSPLGPLRAAALSPDLSWLAVSGRSRGAVWDLRRGRRVFYTRGFRGAYFDGDAKLYADFPEFEETPRKVHLLDPPRGQIAEGLKIEDANATQHGSWILVQKRRGKGQSSDADVTLEVRDARAGTSLWSRHFPKDVPALHPAPTEGTIVLQWGLRQGGARQELEKLPSLLAHANSIRDSERDYFLQVIDGQTGRILGSLIVETGKGSFRLGGVVATGDWVAASDTGNRVVLYSLASGELKARFFGTRRAISASAGLLCIENDPGQVEIYDLGTMERREQLSFSSPVSYAQFSEDGKRLFVLTANQTAFVFDVANASRQRAVSAEEQRPIGPGAIQPAVSRWAGRSARESSSRSGGNAARRSLPSP